MKEMYDLVRYPNRKNPRLKGYNYATPGYYFLTICTDGKRCLFWNNGKCNDLGIIASQAVKEIPLHTSTVKIDKYVIMPNHVHMIVVLEDKITNLSVVIGQYKSYVSKKIHEIKSDLKVWQVSFHDHKIRNQKQYEKIWMYIENNPIQWELDCFYINEMHFENSDSAQ